MNSNNVHYFDTSESSSDDEIIIDYILMRRPKMFRPRNPPIDHWDDEDFLKRYRLSKDTVMRIVSQIESDISALTTRNHALTPLEQLLLTLRFYATGNMQQCSGDLFGVSKSTACKVIHTVSRQICVKFKNFIAMPCMPEEIREVVQGFFAIAKFPSVIGAIDCTHIRIASPGGDNAELYRNRKDVFSINTQVVVDARRCTYTRRFPCVGLKLRVKLANVQAIIVSTAILHNICIAKNDMRLVENMFTDDNTVTESISPQNAPLLIESQSDRQQIINSYFESMLSMN